MIMMQQYLEGTIITWYLNNILSDDQNITNPFLHDVPYADSLASPQHSLCVCMCVRVCVCVRVYVQSVRVTYMYMYI